MRSDFGNRSGQSSPVPAARPKRWQRALLLVSALLSLFFVAAAEFGRSNTSGTSKEGIFAALKEHVVTALRDPIAILADRSPGRRGPGALHLTKSGAAPHERVLSQVRERPVVIDLPPAAVAPLFADNAPAVASPPGVPPEDFANGQSSGSFFPTFINTPFGFPGIATSTPNNSGDTDTPTGGADVPPGGTDTPGVPGGPDTPPPTITLPEPATWLLMILGLAVFITMRRREGLRTA